MPVSVARSLVIIAAVAGTIFFTRLCPFLFFTYYHSSCSNDICNEGDPISAFPKRKRDSTDGTVSWKSIAAGSHRNVGDLLFKGGKYHILSIWITGVYCGGSSDTASCLETKQPA